MLHGVHNDDEDNVALAEYCVGQRRLIKEGRSELDKENFWGAPSPVQVNALLQNDKHLFFILRVDADKRLLRVMLQFLFLKGYMLKLVI